MKLHVFSLLAFAAAAYPATVISDGNFTSGWTDSLLTVNVDGSTATSAILNVPSGGNPAAYRLERHNFTQVASPPDLAGLNWLSLYTLGTYDPSSQGAITSLDFSFDLIKFGSGLTPGYGLAIMQNGQLFRFFDGTVTANSSSWTTTSRTGLTAGSFHEINQTATTYAGVVNLSSLPNFSATGAPMQFGYIVLNGFGGNASAATGLDNFNVTINSAVPEPSTYACAAAALAVLAIARRRRR